MSMSRYGLPDSLWLIAENLRTTAKLYDYDVSVTIEQNAALANQSVNNLRKSVVDTFNEFADNIEEYIRSRDAKFSIYAMLKDAVAWLDGIMKDEEEGITECCQREILKVIEQAKRAMSQYAPTNYDCTDNIDDARRQYNEWVEKVWDDYKKAGIRTIPPLEEWLYMKRKPFKHEYAPHDITQEKIEK